MKISREIGGVVHEIELTDRELYAAYEEQEHIFDREDVREVFDNMTDKDVLDTYGITASEASSLIEAMAYEKRRQIDKYGTEWFEARDDAIREIIDRYMKEKSQNG